MKEQTIESWRDLERFGFIMLTSEACGTGQRFLIDLTQDGLDNLNTFLSCQIVPGNNWNSNDGQIASVMLPYDFWRQLGIFLLLGEGYDRVVDVRFRGEGYSSNHIRGMSEEEWEESKPRHDHLFPNSYRVYWKSGTAKQGLRNTHRFTGRVE
jgi:hypothetical protein